MIGVTVKEITSDFPYTNLKKATAEIKVHMLENGLGIY